MRDDAGRGTDEPGESRDGSWDGPASPNTREDERDSEEPETTYYNQEYETFDSDQEDDDSSGNVAGEFRPSEEIEPGTPSLENSLFVVFGAYIAVLGFTRLFLDVQGFDARDVVVLTGGTLLISIVLFGFLGVLTPDT